MADASRISRRHTRRACSRHHGGRLYRACTPSMRVSSGRGGTAARRRRTSSEPRLAPTACCMACTGAARASATADPPTFPGLAQTDPCSRTAHANLRPPAVVADRRAMVLVRRQRPRSRYAVVGAVVRAPPVVLLRQSQSLSRAVARKQYLAARSRALSPPRAAGSGLPRPDDPL